MPTSRPKKFRVAGDDGGRQAPLAHEVGGSIDIGEDRFQQLGTLDQSGLELLPFRRIDQQRHMTERPGPHRPRGIFIDPIKHAGVAKVPVGRRKPPVHFFRSECREHPEERAPMFAHPAVMIHHLVEIARKDAVVARQQRLKVLVRPRRAVGMSHARHQI